MANNRFQFAEHYDDVDYANNSQFSYVSTPARGLARIITSPNLRPRDGDDTVLIRLCGSYAHALYVPRVYTLYAVYTLRVICAVCCCLKFEKREINGLNC